jgi:5-methylcytosine-specific restriction endonuclease McrA
MPGRSRTYGIRQQHHRLIQAATVCAICGESLDKTAHYLDPMAPAVDHIRAVAVGGGEETSNKQVAHRKCNAHKAARTHAAIVRRSGILR